MTNKPPTLLLRDLYIELANQLSGAMTFNQIAELFFRHDIIHEPERPYGEYNGSKYEYVLEKLVEADNVEDFISHGVTELIFGTDEGVDGVPLLASTHRLKWILEQLGFKKEEEEVGPPEYGIVEYHYVSPDNLSERLDAGTHLSAVTNIDGKGLPSDLSHLIDELNDNIKRNNVVACALLSRRVITLASAIALKRAGKADLLRTTEGKDRELGSILQVCRTELGIAPQTMARITSAKWIGDSANHSYLLRINAADVILCTTALRLYLDELNLT